MNLPTVQKFDFESRDLTDEQKMGFAVIAQRIGREAGDGISGWVRQIALKFNNPINGVKAADDFKVRIEELIEAVKLKQQELCGFKLTNADLDDLKLTGRSALAAAFKKVFSAMELGGDLLALETVSQCQKYVSNKRKEEADNNRATRLREGAKAQAIQEGLVPDTPQFNSRVAELVSGLTAVKTGKAANSDDYSDEPLDNIDKALREMSVECHKLMQFIPEEEVLTLIEGYTSKFTKNLLHHMAMKSGVVDNAA